MFGSSILMVPSKSNRCIPGQYDLPSSSEVFQSEQARKDFVKKWLNPMGFSTRQMKEDILIVETPIKFPYTDTDKAEERLFTGYTVIVNKEYAWKHIMAKKGGIPLNVDSFMNASSNVVTTVLFEKAIKAFAETATVKKIKQYA